MKKYIILLIALFVSVSLFYNVNSASSEQYVPITTESVTVLTEHVRSTFYAEEFKTQGKFVGMAVDGSINQNPSFFSDMGLYAMEPYTMIVNIAWPIEYGGLVNPEFPWVVPKQVLKDSNIPITIVYNSDFCNSMNDMAIQGLTIHDMMHMVDYISGFTNNMVSLMEDCGYGFRELAIDAIIISAKNKYGVVPYLYEWELWGDEMLPGGPGLSTWTIKYFYFQEPDYIKMILPGVPLEYILSPVTIETLEYLDYDFTLLPPPPM